MFTKIDAHVYIMVDREDTFQCGPVTLLSRAMASLGFLWMID